MGAESLGHLSSNPGAPEAECRLGSCDACGFWDWNWWADSSGIQNLLREFDSWHSRYLDPGIYTALKSQIPIHQLDLDGNCFQAGSKLRILFVRNWTRFDKPKIKKLKSKLAKLDKYTRSKRCVMLTLTVDPKLHACPVQALRKLKIGFSILRERLIKSWDFDPRRNPYLAVVEISASDPGEHLNKIHIHLHVVIFGLKWLAPQKWISEQMAWMGIGQVTWISSRSKSGISASRYALKYILKNSNPVQCALLWASNCHAYSISRELQILASKDRISRIRWEFLRVVCDAGLVQSLEKFNPVRLWDGSILIDDPPPQLLSILEYS